jgi:hypothetical protein
VKKICEGDKSFDAKLSDARAMREAYCQRIIDPTHKLPTDSVKVNLKNSTTNGTTPSSSAEDAKSSSGASIPQVSVAGLVGVLALTQL